MSIRKTWYDGKNFHYYTQMEASDYARIREEAERDRQEALEDMRRLREKYLRRWNLWAPSQYKDCSFNDLKFVYPDAYEQLLHTCKTKNPADNPRIVIQMMNNAPDDGRSVVYATLSLLRDMGWVWDANKNIEMVSETELLKLYAQGREKFTDWKNKVNDFDHNKIDVLVITNVGEPAGKYSDYSSQVGMAISRDISSEVIVILQYAHNRRVNNDALKPYEDLQKRVDIVIPKMSTENTVRDNSFVDIAPMRTTSDCWKAFRTNKYYEHARGIR